MTDNRKPQTRPTVSSTFTTRTAANLGGEQGSVGFMFDRKGEITYPPA